MGKLGKKEKIIPTEFFRKMSIIWTWVCMALMVLDFLKLRFVFTDHIIKVTFPTVMLYLTVVAIYTAGIQRRKWNRQEKDGIRRGEWYLYAWWILALIFVIVHTITGLELPELFPELLEGVTGIFCGGKLTKYIRLAKLAKTK